MNYIGASYGSYLGATYANLFPGRVRAMTLAWATGTDGSAQRLGTFLRLRTDQASAAALGRFLDLCGRAATGACAFSAGSPAATHATWNTLLARLDRHPVTVVRTTVTAPAIADQVVSSLASALPIAVSRPAGRARPEPSSSSGH